MRMWDDRTVGTLVCRAILPVTDEVSTFVLAPREPCAFAHLPGQYLTLGVEIDGRVVERCYTISSPPTRPHTVSITVKREPAGAVSPWLHDHLHPGGTVTARGPLGQFSSDLHPAERYLFLAGGVGITPLMSMLRARHDRAERADVVLVHHARTPSHLVFAPELTFLNEVMPGLTVRLACDEDPTGTWPGALGRLTAGQLLDWVPDLARREVFACGPAPYLAAVSGVCAGLGLPADALHVESFVLPARDPGGVPEIADAATGGHVVEFRRSGKRMACPPRTSVLRAASDAGIRVASSCGEGMCGTCKVELVSGSVDMLHNGGIRPREIAAGMILLCCSTPLEDLVIDA